MMENIESIVRNFHARFEGKLAGWNSQIEFDERGRNCEVISFTPISEDTGHRFWLWVTQVKASGGVSSEYFWQCWDDSVIHGSTLPLNVSDAEIIEYIHSCIKTTQGIHESCAISVANFPDEDEDE